MREQILSHTANRTALVVLLHATFIFIRALATLLLQSFCYAVIHWRKRRMWIACFWLTFANEKKTTTTRKMVLMLFLANVVVVFAAAMMLLLLLATLAVVVVVVELFGLFFFLFLLSLLLFSLICLCVRFGIRHLYSTHSFRMLISFLYFTAIRVKQQRTKFN